MKSPKRKAKLENKSIKLQEQSAKLRGKANMLTDEGKTVRAGITAGRAGIKEGRADRLTTKMYKKKGGTTTTKMKVGGSTKLKKVPSNNTGLSKLPTSVRNKMGYKEAGGTIAEDCVSQGPGKPKKCRAGQKRRNFDAKRTAGNVLKGIGAAAGAVGVGLAAKFVKDNKKKGGVIKNKK